MKIATKILAVYGHNSYSLSGGYGHSRVDSDRLPKAVHAAHGVCDFWGLS